MTKSGDLRWLAIVYVYLYSIEEQTAALLLDVHVNSIKNWIKMFDDTGSVEPKRARAKKVRWPPQVLEHVNLYISEHPCFYIDELRLNLSINFPNLTNISTSTICLALRFDLEVSRKVLSKRAKEASEKEIDEYIFRLKKFYKSQEQLVFVDETSKDGRSATRRFAWSKIGKPAVVNCPFSRGNRISVLAAVDCSGFISFEYTSGTFDRLKFHKAMIEKIIPLLNPYPLPRSIVILDNAKIHMYQSLIDACSAVGALVIFLPPYCPQLNPIEFCFSLLKRWIQKHANMVFPQFPHLVIKKAIKHCTVPEWKKKSSRCEDLFPYNSEGILEREISKKFKRDGNLSKLFSHCGYLAKNLRIDSHI